jgi:hypothetical protein
MLVAEHHQHPDTAIPFSKQHSIKQPDAYSIFCKEKGY